MDRAHHVGPTDREFEERALPETDLRTVAAGRPYGGETQFVEQSHEPVNGFDGPGCFVDCGRGGDTGRLVAAPEASGLHDPALRIRISSEAGGEHLGEHPKVPWTDRIHAPGREKQLRWPSRAAGVGGRAFDLTVADQALEMKTCGVGVDPEPFGDLGDGNRPASFSQEVQHLPAASARLLILFRHRRCVPSISIRGRGQPPRRVYPAAQQCRRTALPEAAARRTLSSTRCGAVQRVRTHLVDRVRHALEFTQ